MAGFEDLIRSTLAKQPNTDAARRQSIYDSSRQALERMVSGNTNLTPDAIAEQRTRLEEAIARVEADFERAPPPPQAAPVTPPAQAMPSAVGQPVAPSVGPADRIGGPAATAPSTRPTASSPTGRVEPGFGEPTGAPRPAPQPSVAAAAPNASQSSRAPSSAVPPPPDLSSAALPPQDQRASQSGQPGSKTPVASGKESEIDALLNPKKPPSRLYAKLLLWTIIFVGLGVGIWWVYTFGRIALEEQLGGRVPNPPTTIETGGFNPNTGEGWVTVFAADTNAADIDTTGRGRAELIQKGNITVARISTNAGSTSNTVRIRVPRGVMQSLKGKAATFELTLSNPGSQPHQFAVFCEFAEMGQCGRKRFEAKAQTEAFVFDVLVNDTELPDGKTAYLAITTDLSGAGKPVDLRAIRVYTDPS